ncbi:MAG: AsmA-like C-terminal region-containing protein [Bacteroidales bacterium]|nr:AsmA-like C-terminal region-containing protein [Bacteroidales bacterium]
MKLILKILKLFAILIITVSIILFSASFLLQDKVADIILKSLNKNLSTKLDVGSFKLSFLRKFPNASLELKDVLVHSSSNFSSDAFTGINTDTLLAARFVSVKFKITDILKGIYNIESVGVRAGKMNFFTDTAGLVNYDISVKNESSGGDDFTIDLERINLTDIKTYYNNRATKLIINGLIKEGQLKSRILGDDVDFAAVAEMQIESFQLCNTKITKTIEADLDLTLQRSKIGIMFKKGTLSIENYDFGLDGFVSSDNMLDLNITGHNIDISKIRNYLPGKYLKMVSEYDPTGILVVNSKIKGILSRTSNPHIEINCILNNGHIAYGKSDLTINDLSFAGYFSNGSKNHPETSSVSIKDLKAKLGSAEYTGSFTLYRFDNPTAALLLKGKVIPAELKEFFDLQNISTAAGSVDLDLKMVSSLSHKGKYTLSDIIDMKPEADLVFNSFSIGLKNDKMLFNQVNGNLSISNSIQARNFPEWLAGRPVQMVASADVSFSRLILELFIKNSPTSDTSTLNKSAFTLPEDLILDINFKIDSLNFKSFSASKVAGSLNYKPRLLTFKSLNMQSLNGMISGNGFIIQNSNKSVIARGSFNVSKIDVNKAFTTFHNFGQDFLKAENIAGTLSGSLSLLLPMDSMLHPQIKSLTAEGKYLVVNGALINFDPVKQLSTFIELSELENISFEQLENDFFIRNNFLYIPQMDVKSSAVDLFVNGKHSFDNDYEYHVKMLLSEILSKKRKKSKSNISEFGVIEDDGLGRTSLLLKIEGKGETVKVGYDIKAASSEVKNNFKSERQTLKTILNQEYGWFKSDTTVKQKPAEKKSRFRITWEKTDTVKTTPDPPVVKKESVL